MRSRWSAGLVAEPLSEGECLMNSSSVYKFPVSIYDQCTYDMFVYLFSAEEQRSGGGVLQSCHGNCFSSLERKKNCMCTGCDTCLICDTCGCTTRVYVEILKIFKCDKGHI